jgi:hypothetical protein
MVKHSTAAACPEVVYRFRGPLRRSGGLRVAFRHSALEDRQIGAVSPTDAMHISYRRTRAKFCLVAGRAAKGWKQTSSHKRSMDRRDADTFH